MKTERLDRLIRFLVPAETFQELHIPMVACAVDLHTGKQVWSSRGNLLQALVASTSIPGYLPPVPTNEGLLTDGSVGQPIPGEAARHMGADFIIGVDVSLRKFAPLTELNIPGILGRVSEISSSKLSSATEGQCDIILRPDTLDLHWSQFDQIDPLIKNGEQAVAEQLENINRKLRPKIGFKSWWNRFTGQSSH